jgi:hypothetical protein
VLARAGCSAMEERARFRGAVGVDRASEQRRCREEGEGADGRARGVSGRCGAEGRRAGPRAQVGRARGSGRRKKEAGCEGEKGEVGRGERNRPKRERGAGQAGLGPRFALPFPSLFFSNSFETQIYLNSNELLNSNPVHSF